MEAAGAVDAKSTRPPLLGKLQNSFPQLPQASSFFLGIAHILSTGFGRAKLGPMAFLPQRSRDQSGVAPTGLPNRAASRGRL